MNNKWAAAKKNEPSEEEIVARRRAALAAIEKEEADEAEAELAVANKAHQRADRSLSKGRNNNQTMRAEMCLEPGGNMLKNQASASQASLAESAEDIAARKRAEARAAIRAEESENNRRQELSASKVHNIAG